MKRDLMKTAKKFFAATLAVSMLVSNADMGGLFKNMSVTAFAEETETPEVLYSYYFDGNNNFNNDGWSFDGRCVLCSGGKYQLGYNNNSDYLISPEIGDSEQDILLHFSYWVGNENTSATSTASAIISVGYSTTDNNKDSFEWRYTDTLRGDGSWHDYNIDLPKGTKYIAIKHQDSTMTIKDYTVYKAHAPYSVTLTGGANAAVSGGSTTQTDVVQMIDRVTYTAKNGYYFEKFDPITKDGITAEYKDNRTVVVSGLPTADTSLDIPDAAAYPVYTVELTGGANAAVSGKTTQSGYSAINTVTYTANNGYMFNEFDSFTNSGITVTWKGESSVEVSGTPTANVSIVVPDAVVAHYYTVYDGNDKNKNVPLTLTVFIKNAKGQYIIPADTIKDYKGKQITALEYYADEGDKSTDAKIDVFLTEVDYTTLNSMVPKDGCETVFSGYRKVSSDGVMTLTFDKPYLYKGGNLLIGMESTVPAYDTFDVYFYGTNVDGASLSYFENSTAKQENFIPKTRFTFADNTQPMYTVTLPDKMVLYNKNILLDGKAESGAKIKFKPQDGYGASYVMANDTLLQADADGYYSFTVEDSDVNVTAVFYEANENEVTVYDGEATNGFIPFSASWSDSENVLGQFIVPKAYIEENKGKLINSLKFYTDRSATSSTQIAVYLKEVDYTTFGDTAEPKGNCTTVYNGTISVKDQIMNLKFDTPYMYNGGNLLIGVENTRQGGSVYFNFYGESVDGVSIGGVKDYDSGPNIVTGRNFAPKTTILFEDAHDKFSAEMVEELKADHYYTYGTVDSGDNADKDNVYIIYAVAKDSIEGKDRVAVMHKESDDTFKEISGISNSVIDTVYKKIKFPDGSVMQAEDDKYIVAVKLNNTERIVPNAEVFKFDLVSDTTE